MSRRQSLGALALASSSTVVALAATGVAAASPVDDDPVVALWREWQVLEDRRVDLQVRHDSIYESLPDEMKRVPAVHYATLYRGEAAPGEEPQGQKVYVMSEHQIDALTGPVPGGNGPGYMARLAAWKADLKRQLAAAEERQQAEFERLGLNAVDSELDEITDRQLEVRDKITGAAAVSPASVAAKLFLAVQEELDDHRKLAIIQLPVVEIIANALRDMAMGLPEDLKARVDRLVAAGPDGNFGEALRPAGTAAAADAA